MSIKTNSKELIEIAQEIADRKKLNIKELVETNRMEEVNQIWKEAVKEYDNRHYKNNDI